MLKKLSFPLVSLSLLLASAAVRAGHLDDLPDETTLHIISFLPPKDVINLSEASQRYNALSRDNKVWSGLLTPNMREVADALKADADQKGDLFSFREFFKANTQDPILFLIDNPFAKDTKTLNVSFADGERQPYCIMKIQFLTYSETIYNIDPKKDGINGRLYIFRKSYFGEDHPHFIKSIQWNSTYPTKQCQVFTSRPSVVHGDKLAMPYSKVILTQLPSLSVFCEHPLPSNLPDTRSMTLEERESYAQSHPNLSDEDLDKYRVQEITRFTLSIFPDYLKPVLKVTPDSEENTLTKDGV